MCCRKPFDPSPVCGAAGWSHKDPVSFQGIAGIQSYQLDGYPCPTETTRGDEMVPVAHISDWTKCPNRLPSFHACFFFLMSSPHLQG